MWRRRSAVALQNGISQCNDVVPPSEGAATQCNDGVPPSEGAAMQCNDVVPPLRCYDGVPQCNDVVPPLGNSSSRRRDVKRTSTADVGILRAKRVTFAIACKRMQRRHLPS